MTDARPHFRAAALTALLAASGLVLGCGPASSAYAESASQGASALAAAAASTAAPAFTATAARSAAPAPAAAPASQQLPTVTVYKSPTCGCCEAWVKHLEANGFKVVAKNEDDIDQVKDMLGIPLKLRSCHTAIVGKYLVEGHVPASDIERLLAEKPQIAGLAAPGMPMGSPGMEVPGQPAQHYDVLAFDANGKATVFQSH